MRCTAECMTRWPGVLNGSTVRDVSGSLLHSPSFTHRLCQQNILQYTLTTRHARSCRPVAVVRYNEQCTLYTGTGWLHQIHLSRVLVKQQAYLYTAPKSQSQHRTQVQRALISAETGGIVCRMRLYAYTILVDNELQSRGHVLQGDRSSVDSLYL